MTERQQLGRWGEALAVSYLEDRGMTVLDRNWRCRHGEIDIVAMDGDCLVVCEVKTRSGLGFGDPVEAVTWRKYARLRRLAAAWLADRRHKPPPGGHPAALRIDVVGIHRAPGARPRLRHVVGVC